MHPMTWTETLGEVGLHSRQPRGGHFAAWEYLEAIAEDLRVVFGSDGGAFEVVEGRSGFDKT